ncbi:MAG: WD40 repeat domain-containing protein [Aggregatilineales bacterium]
MDGCAISPDGRWIVSALEDYTLKVWDAQSGQEQRTLAGHTAAVDGCAISPDGRWIRLGISGQDAEGVGCPVRDCLTTFYAEDSLNCCAVHPDGVHLVAGSEAGHIYWL